MCCLHRLGVHLRVGADVTIVDPTAPCYVQRRLDEASFFSECEGDMQNKHVLTRVSVDAPRFLACFVFWVLSSLQSTGAQGIESQEQRQHENAKEHAIPGPTTSLLHPARATM